VSDDSTVHRRFPFAMVPEWIVYHDKLSDRAVRLWAVLARHGTETGSRCPGRARLATLCGGCSMSALDRARRELVEAGALVVKPRFHKPGKGDKGVKVPNDQRTNEYHLVDEPSVENLGGITAGDATGITTGEEGVSPRVTTNRESFTERNRRRPQEDQRSAAMREQMNRNAARADGTTGCPRGCDDGWLELDNGSLRECPCRYEEAS
jgi:hypothetical protein